MSWLAAHREIVLALVIALMVAAIGSYAPAFVEGTSLLGVLDDTALLFMLALGQMVVILTRGIDLSIAANLALTGMLVALVGQYGPDLPALAYIALAILIGLGFGLGNGLLIGGLGIPPIVVTLGTLSIFRGMIVVIGGGGGQYQRDGPDLPGLPAQVAARPLQRLLDRLAVAILMQLFLARTRTGRGIYAVGGNPTAARYCGLVLERYQVLVYAIAGGIARTCGYLWVARYGVAYSEIASGFELTIIASCVIGGVSIGGGVGTVPGTLLGALFIGVIVNALPTMQVSPFWQMAVAGAAILAAVIINARAEAHPDKLILPEARRAAARARG
ncbi:MAG: ABC transporter permease [Geminicoccaceae bacterium]